LSKLTKTKLEADLINNYDFYKNISIINFLRNVGKYITVNQMIAKESVKRRLNDPER
jgi:tyrosyl-tRNA synthetase